MELKEAALLLSKRDGYEEWLEKELKACEKKRAAEEKKIVEAKKGVAESRLRRSAAVSQGRQFGEAQQVLSAAYLSASEEHREASRAPKHVRPASLKLARSVEVLERDLRAGADYIKRARKGKSLLPEELKELQALQERIVKDFAKGKGDLADMRKKLARLEETDKRLREEFAADLLREEADEDDGEEATA